VKEIGKNQLKAIWAQSHRMGLNGESLHEFVENQTRKKSLRTLTHTEAQQILLQLQQKKSGKIQTGEEGSERGNHISFSQIDFIHGLAKEMDWNRFRTQRLTQRMYGLRKLERMNKKQASGLIEALKAIKKRKAA
jgi:hypothetical protein